MLIYICHFCAFGGTKTLRSLSHQHFFNILRSGKTSLIYFRRTVNPTVRLFLEQLEQSSEPLDEYGITVAQVNCAIENIPKYCEDEGVQKKAYLFRGNIMLRSFATDTLFDVDATVANVLFILLFNEIRYVSSMADLQDIENNMKGKGDVIFTFVGAIGVPEHRAIMETAFVYGSKYQFVLTTEQALLEGLGFSARLWFCHCKMVAEKSQACRRSYYEQPLTTVNIHRYLKVLDAPLVMEVAVEPEKVSTIHVQLKMPVVFLFTQKETYEHDKTTAEYIAWQTLGIAGVVLAIYRDRKRELNLELLHELTDQSFNATLKGAANVLVVFYTAWDAVSQTFLRSYVEAARRLELFLALVNCGDWPDVCSKQNVIQFPTIKMYSQGDNPLLYNGMLGTESLLKFIMLSREPHPIKLTSVDEVEAYLRGELHSDLRSYWELSVLGLFSPNMKEALVFARHWTSSTECIHIEKPTTEEIVYAVKNATLEKFPEVTVENLAVYLQTQKPLLILFIDNDDPKTTKAKEELAELIKIKSLQTYTTCWIDLRNTHVGGEILQVYLNHLPQLPVLVLVYIHSGGHVFAFPEEQLISRKDVLRWLNKVQAGQEDPSSK
uniref:Thioredoxin domain containing 16 n=1 Tax=Callorhinchus milii TaxID=7868 RepID=A0A4W3IXP1_CALMI